MNKYIIPTVGMRGAYVLSPPIDQLVLTGEEYTCQAVRKLSDYIANNEDPQADIYEMYGLSEIDFKKDMVEDMLIASLQSDSGHWLYVPVRYLQSFPSGNGVKYRTVMVGVNIGPQPVDKDLTYLTKEIEDLTIRMLGVKPVIKPVATSKPVLVPREKHEDIQIRRASRAESELTDGARYRGILIKYQQALNTIDELKRFIASKLAKTE